MKRLTNFITMLACLSFIVIVGGGFYENYTIVPAWAAAPPASLMMFQGEYAIQYSEFWKLIHPITILMLLAALALNWRTNRRRNFLITLGCYVVILIATFTYYVPELIYITTYPYHNTIDSALQHRAGVWQILSGIRLLCMFGLSFVLLSGLMKTAEAPR